MCAFCIWKLEFLAPRCAHQLEWQSQSRKQLTSSGSSQNHTYSQKRITWCLRKPTVHVIILNLTLRDGTWRTEEPLFWQIVESFSILISNKKSVSFLSNKQRSAIPTQTLKHCLFLKPLSLQFAWNLYSFLLPVFISSCFHTSYRTFI